MSNIPLIKDELIGLQVRISSCTDPTWVQISGVIINETKNTFLIETKGKVKCIGKDTASFTFERNGTTITVSGSSLRHRPEERVKKAR
ncbi:MAG: ribonuclease P protein subunit [Candidatus Thermoplasmatota archaeon]|nr:ribonuclease P protein subunit [Candidatus Thermoplasmatota archaeon]